MPGIPLFSRNRCTWVERLDDRTLRAGCRLQDTCLDAYVEITVGLPDLVIAGVRGEIARGAAGGGRVDPSGALKPAVGVRVGPGMGKILRGLLGSPAGCPQLVFMVEECCHGVILSFTKETLLQVPEGYEPRAEDFGRMVRENTRLYNRCAAFAPGSSLVEGIEPPE